MAYPDSEQSLKAWLNEAQQAEWKDPAECLIKPTRVNVAVK